MMLSCESVPGKQCYQCEISTKKEYCTYSETTRVIEDLRCGWTEEEIRQYETKTTFIMIEKCFTVYQVCKCHKINQ
jgi:hypothetical protein